jgi:hypothetical protein
MSFVAVAATVVGEGLAATLLGGAMMGGTVSIVNNVVHGQNPFDNILEGALTGAVTAGIAPGVSEAAQISLPTATAVTTGGITALRTGDLGKGLMAGMTAYGMSSMAGNMDALGETKLNAENIANAEIAQNSVTDATTAYNTDMRTFLEGNPEFNPVQSPTYSDSAIKSIQEQAAQEVTDNARFTPAQRAVAGREVIADKPGAFLKANAKNLMYAGLPMLMDSGTQDSLPTTAQTPSNIRRFSYDPYSGQYTSQGMYPAAQDRGMASGGIASLANGGAIAFAAGDLVLPTDWANRDAAKKVEYFNENKITPAQLAGANVAGSDIEWMQKYGGYNVADTVVPITTPTGWGSSGGAYDTPKEKIDYFNQNNITPAQLLASGQNVTQDDINWMTDNGYAGNNIAAGSNKYVQNINDYFTNNPNATYTEIQKAAEGLNPADVQAAMAKAGLSGATQFAALNKNIGDTSNVEETYGGLKGLSSNINYWITNHPGASLNDFQNEMKKWDLNETDISRATGKTSTQLYTKPITNTGNNPAAGSDKYVQNVNDYFTNNPNATYADIVKAEDNYLKPADVAAAMAKAGLSGAAIYAATNEKIGPTENPNSGGLAGLSSNIQYWLKEHPGASLNDVRSEMNKWQLSDADIVRATGKTPEQLTTGKITEVYNPAEGVGGSTGAGAVGGGTVVNPNGTITTSPVIPGIPIGGFTGMTQVKNAYTTGGGSTGYTPYTPKTMEEFNTKYNTLSGDSAAMYDYLTGKPGARYPMASQNKELMRPYSEAVLGIQPAAGRPTQKTIYDRATQTYKANPDYVPVTYDTSGNKSYGLTNNQIMEYLKTNASAADASKYDWAKANSIDIATLAALMGKTLAEVRDGLKGSKSTPGSALVSATGGTRGTTASTTADTVETTPYTGGSKNGGLMQSYAGGGLGSLGGYSDGGRLLRGPGDGVSDSIPASIGNRQPARLADGEFVVPARIVSELGNGSTEAGARKLYQMMDRVQQARGKTTGKDRVATNSRSDKYLPA